MKRDRDGGPFKMTLFLFRFVWPLAKSDAVSHDSYNCTLFPNTQPFPTERIRQPNNFVGSIVISNNTLWVECPIECRPKDHPDWIHCWCRKLKWPSHCGILCGQCDQICRYFTFFVTKLKCYFNTDARWQCLESCPRSFNKTHLARGGMVQWSKRSLVDNWSRRNWVRFQLRPSGFFLLSLGMGGRN